MSEEESLFSGLLSSNSRRTTIHQTNACRDRVSKFDQQKLIIFQHNLIRSNLTRFGIGENMLGYGLLGTIVVIALIVFFVRAL